MYKHEFEAQRVALPAPFQDLANTRIVFVCKKCKKTYNGAGERIK